ncbi:MAG TPA: response regulator transcription factor, partial [Vicinamibacterales bacterium]|nr:response regulator transcription factor [Vicinamibacterales bacterium]
MSATLAARRPSVIIGDEHLLFAEALASLLESEFEILHVTDDLQGLADDVLRLHPDVVLQGLPMQMPGGLALVEQIHRRSPHARIVVVTMWDDAATAAEAFRRGASAFVLKSSSVSELLEAVRAVLRGTSYVTLALAGSAIQELSQPKPAAAAEALTPRQRAVLQELAAGKSMKEA